MHAIKFENNPKPFVRILVAISSHMAQILAFDHELVADAILYNGPNVENIIYPEPTLPADYGFWIWEGIVTYRSDGDEQWEGTWKKATDKETLYYHYHGKLLPVINTLEEGLEFLQLTHCYPQLLQITQQIFNVVPEVKIEESYDDFYQPYYLQLKLCFTENSDVKTIVEKESEWHRTAEHGTVRLLICFEE